jgi:hypothetical protein
MTSADVNSRSDGIEVLIADHREVEGLFSAVESSASAERSKSSPT